MIPDNPDDLHALAGEYVLGVLDEAEASEVAGALASNFELRRAVRFWERQLHPLSELTAPAEPPPVIWERIEARIAKPASKPAAPGFWNNIALWRWSTAGLAAAAASLGLWIALIPASGPSFVAGLHPPQQDQVSWVAAADRSSLVVHALSAATAPNDRVFELWTIAPGAAQPRSLGVIPRKRRAQGVAAAAQAARWCDACHQHRAARRLAHTAADRAGGVCRHDQGGMN